MTGTESVNGTNTTAVPCVLSRSITPTSGILQLLPQHHHDHILRWMREMSTVGQNKIPGKVTALCIQIKPQLLNLERNELIILFNFLYKLSNSDLIFDEMEAKIQVQK